ncbi:hypothetical protein F4805DRAFT_219809 [Annulohypoxylon moriforme]|nr:hypothetical protein F4805DRAFT_219809 [Annulohypoxylon moriforme]
MMQYAGLIAPCLIPIAYLVLSFLAFHIALHAKKERIRFWVLPVYYWFSILSFIESKHLHILPGLTSLWAQSTALNIVHVTSLLLIDRWPAPPLDQSKKKQTCISTRAFYITYRLWSNPRLLPIQVSNNPAAEKHTVEPLSVFIILRIAKDVAQPTHLVDLTARDILVRAYSAGSWIWESFAALDGSNAVLAIIAVLFGLDEPSDWPPLFGSPVHVCYGLRGFWSGFWHRLAVRSYSNVGRLIARSLGLIPSRKVGRVDKGGKGVRGVGKGSWKWEWKGKCADTVVAFIAFTISGLSHAAVSWRLGASDYWRDGLWFMLNFAACALETGLKGAVRWAAERLGWEKELSAIERSWLGKVMGFMWVSVFFSWSVPLWSWPRVYRGLVAERLMRMLMNA